MSKRLTTGSRRVLLSGSSSSGSPTPPSTAGQPIGLLLLLTKAS